MAVYSEFSDQELIVLLKQDDRVAFTELYDRYWAALYLHARKLLKNDEESKDITQELFTWLWSKREALDFNTSLKAYLYKATRNKILNYISRKKIIDEYEASLAHFMKEGTLITDELVREKELSFLIEKEIKQLPPKMREVFELSRKRHLNYKQISALLGISDHTVKRQVSNALAVLRTKLKISAELISLALLLNGPNL